MTNGTLLTAAQAALMTTVQAAELLQVRPATLEMMRWKGTGPKFVKVGRSCRYRIVDLESYLEVRTFGSTTEAQQAA